jgi:hypothetical protein
MSTPQASNYVLLPYCYVSLIALTTSPLRILENNGPCNISYDSSQYLSLFTRRPGHNTCHNLTRFVSFAFFHSPAGRCIICKCWMVIIHLGLTMYMYFYTSSETDVYVLTLRSLVVIILIVTLSIETCL